MDEFKAVHDGGARRVNLAHGVLFRETDVYRWNTCVQCFVICNIINLR